MRQCKKWKKPVWYKQFCVVFVCVPGVGEYRNVEVAQK